VIANFQPKLLPFFEDVLLHSRLTDSHQVKDGGVAWAGTAKVLDFGPFAHEMGSVEAPKGGGFRDGSCINVSFLQLPSHILLHYFVLHIYCALEYIIFKF